MSSSLFDVQSGKTCGLGKAKVLASSRHGRVECFAEVFISFVLGKVELFYVVSIMRNGMG